jgi:hypothetical protein
MSLLPTGPQRRLAIVQLIGFIAVPVVAILAILLFILVTR